MNGKLFPLFKKIDCVTESFEIAEKKIEVAQTTDEEFMGKPMVFLNGIPTVVSGDSKGNSQLYQAKTKDGTLDVYQKNEDGTFKKDENGNRICNIVRDEQTGMAVKDKLLLEQDVADWNLCGGANGKSVEDVYVEVHQGGGILNLIAGCVGGNSGYNEKGEETGLNEVRMFGGGIFSSCYLGNKPVDENKVVKCARNVFMGFDGTVNNIVSGGYAGVVGEEKKYKNGYYGKKSIITKGKWKEYNLNVKKKDYIAYYDSTNAYFNGEDNRDFVKNPYYTDPYDDHYTGYILIVGLMPQNIYLGTKQEAAINRVYGNQYLRHTAYGVRYDAKYDRFVENYNDYKGMNAIAINIFAGCVSGELYGDTRVDLEGVYIKRNLTANGKNYGKVYINHYTHDKRYEKELYERVITSVPKNVKIKEDFYPRWCLGAAWALNLDECMPALAIERGYITETDNPKDVRLHMLSAENAAKLLSFYYTGSEDFMTADKEVDTQNYKKIYDASQDKGKFVIRVIDPRGEDADGINRYANFMSQRPGDCILLTFPNGENMLIDTPVMSSAPKIIRNLENYLQSAKSAGLNDGNTIDNIMISHWHIDHDGSIAAVIDRFDVKNIFVQPFEMTSISRYVDIFEAIKRKNEKYEKEGKPPVNVIRPAHDDVYYFGEGDEKTEMYMLGPRDYCYLNYTLEELREMAESGDYNTKIANSTSLCARFSYKGQRFLSCGDITQYAERVLIDTYGKDFMKCDVLKINHHGYAGCNSYVWLNTCRPDVVVQNLSTLANPTMAIKYCEGNNMGNPDTRVYQDGRVGSVRIELDGEKITEQTQFYKNV